MTIGGGDRVRIVGNGEPMGRIAEALVQASIAVQDDMPPRFLEALKTQLGLTLSSTKGPVDILVVDQVARPTEN